MSILSQIKHIDWNDDDDDWGLRAPQHWNENRCIMMNMYPEGKPIQDTTLLHGKRPRTSTEAILSSILPTSFASTKLLFFWQKHMDRTSVHLFVKVVRVRSTQ